jgi:SAM-dependent methyltransferase
MTQAHAPRGYRGTMVAPTALDDESYLEAVQALRGLAMGMLNASAQSATAEAVERGDGRDELGIEAVGAITEVAVRDRVLRSSQEMLWRRTSLTYDRNREALHDWLEHRPQSTLTLSPTPMRPSYLREYHLQPGGYHEDELAGFIYHYGTKIFWLGHNDQDQAKAAIVDTVPVPSDAQVNRVLELGCSVGQSTTAFKERFPEAEVWGVDLAAPVLQCADARAQRLGVDVRFAQQPAEALEFADGTFDLVFASLLFHEVPVATGEQIVREAARVLRPGGLLVVNDLNPLALGAGSWSRYDRWWDTFQNCEPYELDFLESDFVGALSASFAAVEFEGNGYGGRWVARR